MYFLKTFKNAVLFVLFFGAFACSNDSKQFNSSVSVPDTYRANGLSVPKDSISLPPFFEIDTNQLEKKTALKGKVISANVNMVTPTGVIKFKLGEPKVTVPGKDTFLIPATTIIIDSPFVAGVPEVIIAKDPSVKDQNSQNFSAFSKLQGLKHDAVRCMIQDKSGNIWFGTNGGGVSKYDGKSFTNYTENEGLSNNSVWSMLEDSDGNLWFGTYGGGVSKFDGKYFTNYTKNEGLCNNRVRSLFEDSKGNLWIGTYGGGVSKFQKEKLTNKSSFTNYTEKEGLLNNYVYSIKEDSKGKIWFGTDKGLCCFDGNSMRSYTEKEGLSNNSIWSILIDNKDNIWLGTFGGGACKIEGDSILSLREENGFINDRVWSIYEDFTGNIWFGTDGGVCKYNGISFYYFTESEGLGKNSVWSILEDKSMNLWFGTYGGGVSKYNGKIFTHYTTKEGLPGNNVLSIVNDRHGYLWIGTSNGLCKYDGKTFEIITEKEGLSNNYIRSVIQDSKGNIWIGTSSSGICRYDGKYFTYLTKKEGLCNNSIWCIYEDSKEQIWFGTTDGVSKYDGSCLKNYTQKQGLCNSSIIAITEDRNGNIWFCTDGGLSRYSDSGVVNYSINEGLPNNSVRSVLEDTKGNLWLGTYGGGIVKISGEKYNDFTVLSEKDGLSNNYVFSILEDKYKNLFFGTRFGLCKIVNKSQQGTNNKTGPVFKTYGYEDGFLGIGVSGGKTICEDNEGNIWIGANDRLTEYHPEGDIPDTVPPNIQLTGIDLFNETVNWLGLENKNDTIIVLGNGVKLHDFSFTKVINWYNIPENLSLSYNNNYLTFNFIGITQHQSKKVKYQYKLEGIDNNWSAITERNEAPYGNLPDGSYEFKVKAVNSEGYWSNEYSYSFIIRPPWWKTWWFKTMLILAGILVLIVFIKWRERKLKQDKELLERKVKEQTQELSEKNEELNQQKEEIETQRDLVLDQKNHIEEIHKEVTDSINYAKRIQEAVLPIEKEINVILKDHFILYKPKNIVSGDFYWIHKMENKIIVAVADCTGHGVPGAFMSMLGISYLNEIVRNHEFINASYILKHLRENIINALQQTGLSGEQKDGMDISLLVIDNETKQCQWAGANNPLYIVKSTKLKVQSDEKELDKLSNFLLDELKGDKMPIAIYPEMKDFTNHEFTIDKGDSVYLFTDGYADQFGGPKGRKFMNKKFKELLLSIQNNTMPEQLIILEETLKNWMSSGNKSYSQVDDITVLGIRTDSHF